MTRRAFFQALPVALVVGPSEEALTRDGRIWQWRGGWLGRRTVCVEAPGGGPPLSPEEIDRARRMARAIGRNM